MKPTDAGSRHVVPINIHFFGAAIAACVAFELWPSRGEWWGYGLLSIVLAFAALASGGKAIRLIFASWQQRKTLAAVEAQGGAPKSARLASEADLRRAEMIE